MSKQAIENIQFYISEDTPCPYLPNRNERKIFAHLSAKRAKNLIKGLSDFGFRRSQNIIYRPICKNCNACKPVRVVAKNFVPSKSQRRIINRNKDIIALEKEPIANFEQYELFKNYVKARHIEGNMADMGFEEYELMIEDSPIQTMIVEYRFYENGVIGKLVGVALCDIFDDAISMVYSFFDVDYSSRSLGKYMILENIERVKNIALDYLHLGYWVFGSKKMHYKSEFLPLEIVNNHNGWQKFHRKI